MTDGFLMEYGIMIHDNSLWLHYGGNGNMGGGGKYKSWDLPFFTLENSDSDEDVD